MKREVCLVSAAGLPPNPSDALSNGDGIGRGRLRRAAPLAALSARTAGEVVVAGLRGKLKDTDGAEFHVRTAERYAELLGRSKGALMKAGQMLSIVSIDSAVPSEFQAIYQTALARLRNDAPPMAPELAQTVLERELGRRAESAFAEFDWNPLAAASIGQVHAARLHDGRAVAVKIQYPGVSSAIAADLKNVELLVAFLNLTAGCMHWKLSFDLRAAAREVGTRIAEELDYRREAANQAKFARYYRGHPFIHVPEVIGELCTDRVLTQELMDGLCWNDALNASQEMRNQWAEALCRFVYGSNDRYGMFNADPHPGNYVFHEDGSVSFLDFGCVRCFRSDQILLMKEVMRASCLHNDALRTWRAGVELGYWGSSDPITPEEVCAFWRDPWEFVWAEQPFTLTPEYTSGWVARRYAPTGPWANVLQNITMSPEYTLMGRIELAGVSVLAQLRATNPWRAIMAEFFDDAPPLTEMGKREHAYFAERQVAGHA